MASKATSERYYLYVYPDGRRRVFEDVSTVGGYLSYRVVDETPSNPSERFTRDTWPEDLETVGVEITEERMKRLTGYSLKGVPAV